MSNLAPNIKENDTFVVLICHGARMRIFLNLYLQASDVPGSTRRNLAPEKVADLPQFVTSFFEGLPYTPVICLSVIGGSYASLLQQLLSSDSSASHHREAWILITRLKWDRKPITLLLPISEIIQGN